MSNCSELMLNWFPAAELSKPPGICWPVVAVTVEGGFELKSATSFMLNLTMAACVACEVKTNSARAKEAGIRRGLRSAFMAPFRAKRRGVAGNGWCSKDFAGKLDENGWRRFV